MGRALVIISIITAAFAFLAALMLSQDANFILAPLGLVAAGFLFAKKDTPGIVLGAAAVIFSILGALGIIQRIGSEGGEIDFGISIATGRALLVMAMMSPVTYLVWSGWDTLASWVRYVGAGAAALTALLALAFMGSLGDQTLTGGFLVGFCALASSIPGIMALRA